MDPVKIFLLLATYIFLQYGDVHTGRALNNMDDISNDVKLKADAHDLAEAAEDQGVHNQMKNQPQQFKDGKDFERNVRNDPSHKTKVEAYTGLSLTGYTKVNTVRINIVAENKIMVADDIWVKATGPNTFDVVISESKLSSSAPFSTNQELLRHGLIKAVQPPLLQLKHLNLRAAIPPSRYLREQQ